jgi:hypothetical protein
VLFRSAQRILETFEELRKVPDALQSVVVGLLPKQLARCRLLSKASKGDAMASQ